MSAAGIEKAFSNVATACARAAGRPSAFLLCCIIVIVWAVTGPLFGFSDTWQLVINTGTTIVTFLMVFVIQNTQSRDGAAIQAKLDVIIRSSAAQNLYVGIENLTIDEVEKIRSRCEARAAREMASDKAEARGDHKAEKAAAESVS